MAWQGRARGGQLVKSSADEASRRARVVVALLCVYLFWGTSYVAGKIMVTHLPPVLSAGTRYSIAGLLLAVTRRNPFLTRETPGLRAMLQDKLSQDERKRT